MTRDDVVVVGAGPAGLALGACLRQAGIEPVLLERGAGVGESWRRHYHRLHLHTVRELSELPGQPFPPGTPRYPSREQVVRYLESYAAEHELDIRFGIKVRGARRVDDGWRLDTSAGDWTCRQLGVASGFNAEPVAPRWPGQDDFSGTLEHSRTYRTGSAFAGRRVLVVGAGNSGAEIALDLCEQGAQSAMSIRDSQYVLPRDFLGLPSQKTSVRMRRLPLAVRDLIAGTVSRLAFGNTERYGIRRPRLGPITRILEEGRIPMLDVGTMARIRAGEIVVYPEIERFADNLVCFVDGREAPFDHVVLATGYRTGLADWIPELEPHVDTKGRPTPARGEPLPGLHLVGFDNSPTGLLRQIALEAPAVASTIATALTRDREAPAPTL